MMINFPGYQIRKQIYKSKYVTICQGFRESDNIPVIIKFSGKEYPSLEELARFRREFEIAAGLSGDNIIKVYNLEKYNDSLAFTMEDFEGQSVATILHTHQLPLMDKITIAVKMTEALQQLHAQNIIHKDVNLSNFVWNPDSGQLKIIDFGISIEITKERSQSLNLDILEGTLHYISPEQTGRMNRTIDYRTDFYSLGVTFYELFTNRLPFTGNDEVEIVHAHIASLAIPPKEVNPELPLVLSDIIMKLLSKTVEDRYQSASGLKNDLEYCLQELKDKGKINTFPIAQKDFSSRFQIPQKLYGREEEIETIINTFNKVADGRMELLLVKGYSGVGKSSLIQEIYKPIVKRHGFFISGKFDELEKNNPYNAIIQAIGDLIRQLLSQTHHQLEGWKKRLLDALGSNCQVMTELVPELGQIFGPQPQVVQLNPREAQQRFQMVFREFIQVFAQKNHPLVIFLDDLQWSDLSTLDLVKYLFTTQEIHCLLFIGTYRDNEVQPGHPLLTMLEEIKNKHKGESLPFHQLLLTPLQKPVVNQFLADTFHCGPAATESLSSLVFKKTQGNPFFINQLLDSLYRQGVFIFREDESRWDWDIKEIEECAISDNVVDFLVQRLLSFPSEIQDILGFASCIGSRFMLKTVSLLCDRSFYKAARILLKAIEYDLILPLSSNYRLIYSKNEGNDFPDIDVSFRFHHDRIQQAAYSLVPENDKPNVHLKIGRLLLKTLSKEKPAENIFDLVNHLNMGRDLIRDKKERIRLADLNYDAGKKAKKSTAYAIAASYFRTAISLLSREEWKSDPHTLFTLTFEEVEATFFSGKSSEAEKRCRELFELATNRLDKAAVYDMEARILAYQGEKREIVLDRLRKGLQLFDMHLETDHKEIDQKINAGLGKLKEYFVKTPVDSLLDLPRMENTDISVVMNLLFQAIPAAIQSYFPLFVLIELTMFDTALTHGFTPVCCKNFVDCGIIVGSLLSDYETGYKLGEVAYTLIEKYNLETLKPPVYFIFSTYISHWRKHYQESLDYFDLDYRISLETGDLQYAMHACAHKINRLFYTGENLKKCSQAAEQAIIFFSEINADLIFFHIILHFIQRLQIIPGKKREIDLEAGENKLFKKVKDFNNLFISSIFGQYNTLVNYLFDDMDAAWKWNDFTKPHLPGVIGHFQMPDNVLIQSLLLIKKWKNADPGEQEQIIALLTENLAKLKSWSDNCRENFSHKFYLLSAEFAAIKGESLETVIHHYKMALESIDKNDFIHMKALINELQGDYWIEREYETIGKIFIRNAYYHYKQWGCLAKCHLLEQKYPQCFIDYHTTGEMTIKHTSIKGSHSKAASSLDIAAIIKSTQAISSEVKIDVLLKKIMKTIIDNAGAQHGCLLLKHERDDRLYIEAIQLKDSEKVSILQSLSFHECRELCPEIIQYVSRTMESVVLGNACHEGAYQHNAYIRKNKIKSVVCTPIIYRKKLKGIVYLENNLLENVFTKDRIEVINILSSQASISIDHAGLYENLEEKVKERTIQLKYANEQKTRFFINVAHETKTPLTLIQNYLERCMKRYTSDPELSIVKQNIDILLENMLNFLDAERLAKGTMSFSHDSFIDLSGFVREKCILFQPVAAKKNITITLQAENDVTIKIDTWALDRILNNLLDNAVKYTQKGGKVQVDVKRTAGKAVFRVKDNGPGLSVDSISHLFEPYYQLSQKRSSKQGIGVGLSIVKKIIDDLGASITVANNRGGGASFTCVFTAGEEPTGMKDMDNIPLSKPPAGIVFQEDIAEEDISGDKASILIVDDNVQMLNFLKVSLKKTYNVFPAMDVLSALGKLKTMDRPELIISDIMMDGMDGHILLTTLTETEEYSDIPFIFLTAASSKDEEIRGLAEGAIDYIKKPFSITELEKKIESIITLRTRMKKREIINIRKGIDGLFSMIESGKNPATEKSFEHLCMKYGISALEKKIIRLLLEGFINKEIAYQLHLSKRAVEYHITSIFQKAGVSRRHDLLTLFRI
ncbi:MAG: AAA family ATPase [Spirochaetales bacterium]|nr:AAA family ATPase [Spirochaetales bacterium]